MLELEKFFVALTILIHNLILSDITNTAALMIFQCVRIFTN